MEDLLGHGLQRKVGVGAKKTVDLSLVFLGGKGAGGKEQLPAGTHAGGGVVQDLGSTLGTKSDVLLAPLLTCDLVFAEHALTGAGHVCHDQVKIGAVEIGQRVGGKIGDNGRAQAKTLDVALQDAATGGYVLVADQYAARSDGGRQLRGFSARCGTHIQHRHATFWACGGHGRDGTGVLHIEHAGVMCGKSPHLVLGGVIGRSAKGQRGELKGEQWEQLLGVGLESVDA